MPHAAKVAVVTHARKEPFFCRMWSDHYGTLFGIENLYLVKDGDDWELPTEARFGQIIPTRFPQNRKECDAVAARFLGDLCADLLSRYDAVIRVDVDEFLIVDPSKGTWEDVISEVRSSGYLYAFGLDLVQNDSVERSVDPAYPVLRQRHHAFVNGVYCKPCLISRPVTWTPACHAVEDGPVVLSASLMLVHLASMDRHLLIERLAARGDFDKLSYAGHAGARLRQFREIRKAKALDLDVVDPSLRARVCQDDAGKPALSPRFNVMTLPDGTSYKGAVAVRLPDRFADLIPARPTQDPQTLPPAEVKVADDVQRLQLLQRLLRPERRTIIADVGASPIERPPYAFLLAQNACEVWGFEPQQAEYERLVSQAGENEHYLPFAIGDGTVKPLNITVHSGFTSMLRPNKKYVTSPESLAAGHPHKGCSRHSDHASGRYSRTARL